GARGGVAPVDGRRGGAPPGQWDARARGRRARRRGQRRPGSGTGVSARTRPGPGAGGASDDARAVASRARGAGVPGRAELGTPNPTGLVVPDRALLACRALDAVPLLLGAHLAAASPEGVVVVRITEVEAYQG